jgi:hypothetical protein
MSRRRAIATAVVGAWLVTIISIAPATPATAADTDFSFTDHFSSGRYTGNEGSVDYDGPWWELRDRGGSTKGAIAVVDDGNCPHGPCARIAAQGELWGTGLARRANTEGAVTANLRFMYRLVVDEPSAGRLDIVALDGWNWEVLDSIDLTDATDGVHSRTYDVADYAAQLLTVGFFASGEWRGAVYIDDVEVFGRWIDSAIAEPPTTTTSTTAAPTTTSTSTTAAPTTTSSPPPTASTPMATTTTTVGPPTTTRISSTVTTPPPTEGPKETRNPPITGVPPTTPAPSTEAPLTNDERYRDKGALAFFYFDDHMTDTTGELTTMPGEDALPKPDPVAQIMASLTVTAVTIRSHLLSAIALGLLIAAAAVIGLGRQEERTQR